MHVSMSFVRLVATALACAALQAEASSIAISGIASTGSVAGTPFSNKPFTVRFDVNPAAPITSNTQNHAIQGGSVTINNQTYALIGNSTSGNVYVDIGDGGADIGDAVNFNPDSGGYLQFIVGDNTLFPSGFSGTTLGSIAGLSAINNTTDPYNNAPAVNFQEGGGGGARLGGFASTLHTTGGEIALLGFAGPPSGAWAFNAAPVPEPVTMLGAMSTAALLRRKRG